VQNDDRLAWSGNRQSSGAIEVFARAHWFHSGYTLLVDIVEPAELASTIDIQTSRGPLTTCKMATPGAVWRLVF